MMNSTRYRDAGDYSSYSSDSEDEVVRGRRNIKDVKSFGQLDSFTRAAYFEEANRKLRIGHHEKELLRLFPNGEANNRMILDFDEKSKEPCVMVDPDLVRFLKIHQKEGIRFMWNACFETLSRAKTEAGSGCILAHCMGLGKTLQVISLVHTLMTNPELKVTKVLILCPKNTLLNWVNEFEKWVKSPLRPLRVFNPTRSEESRFDEINRWSKLGGICIFSYNAFRIMIENTSKTARKPMMEAFIDPGADFIICDEGHILKNEATRLAKVMTEIRTSRRVILTGTPLQNNLIEYFCMVNFVRPHLLGTKAEFRNMFVNPIQNGQYENSLKHDVALMKARSHVLHRTLTSCVQRYDYTTLAEFLPKKLEFVLCLRMAKCQIDLYDHYLSYFVEDGENWKKIAKGLFADYQLLQRVWTHPYSLLLYDQRPDKPEGSKQGDDSDAEEVIVRPKRWKKGWWLDFVDPSELENAQASPKVTVLFEIIQQCEKRHEKLLVFSGSLFSLEMIEHFLGKTWPDGSPGWELDSDYFVLTGATSGPDRDELCTRFNDPENQHVKVFLISTKAGGLGITLNAANRAVIFDASWNPSHDIQSIFRIYRLGQDKPCYIYRLVSSGTMEEKIYERQVVKQSISRRVIDEKQITRHYSHAELKELYELDPDRQYNNNPAIPRKDDLLQAVVEKYSVLIGGYHEHDSLLQHKLEEELRDFEKKGAWSEFSGGNSDLVEGCQSVSKMMTPDIFDVTNLKIVLRRKFPHLPEPTIGTLVYQLMPTLQEIMKQPNFQSLMLQEALNSRRREELQKTAQLPPPRSGTSMRNRGLGKTRRLNTPAPALPQPLRSWGTVAGREFGDPDIESESD